MTLRRTLFALATLASFSVARPAEAFLFSEHSRITQRALEDLAVDPDVGSLVRTLVALPELCPREGDMNESDCLRLVADFASIAADHSCTPDELVLLVDESNRARAGKREHWLWSVRRNAWEGDARLNGDSVESRRRLKVIDIMSKGAEVANATIYGDDRRYVDEPEDRAFLRRRINLGMQDIDGDYQSRAVVDGGHFQLAREPGRIDLTSYLATALSPQAEINTTALYAAYHVVAIRLAAAGARRQALLAELFALHFLEDSFSAGHLVGHHGIDTWLLLKSEGLRMGTHDHYSDEGVEVVRWTDLAAPYVAHGDGMMKPIDLGFASVAVKTSLREVLVALQDPEAARSSAARFAQVPTTLSGAFDSCKEEHPPPGLVALAIAGGPLHEVLALGPVPYARTPELPRFRTEAGIFFGGSAALDGGGATGDGGVGRARAAIRGGVGLNGLMIDPLNSIAFAEVGIVALGTNLDANAHSDAGVTFRVRSPGLVTLVDGAIVLGLLGAGIRAPWLIGLGSIAGSGGVAPVIWRSHHLGGPWDFQISALREAAFNLYFRDAGRFRWEFQAPVVTFRTANPIAGLSWAQSNDFWMDIGFSAGRGTEVINGSFGAYLAFTASARSFP